MSIGFVSVLLLLIRKLFAGVEWPELFSIDPTATRLVIIAGACFVMASLFLLRDRGLI